MVEYNHFISYYVDLATDEEKTRAAIYLFIFIGHSATVEWMENLCKSLYKGRGKEQESMDKSGLYDHYYVALQKAWKESRFPTVKGSTILVKLFGNPVDQGYQQLEYSKVVESTRQILLPNQHTFLLLHIHHDILPLQPNHTFIEYLKNNHTAVATNSVCKIPDEVVNAKTPENNKT